MLDYIAKVKKSLEETKKLALVFKKAGKMDEAKKAMARIKLMTQEIEEVESG